MRRWYDGVLGAGVSDYRWQQCWEDYLWATISSLKTTVLGAAFSNPTERGERMFIRMAGGQAEQILDLGAIDLLRG